MGRTTSDDNTTVNRFCWSCDYPLTGIASTRCPECGRRFDLADPHSTRTHRPIGNLGRWIAAGTGRVTFLLALAGSALVLAATRWPLAAGDWGFFDIPYFFGREDWIERSKGFGRLDWAYVIGLPIAAVALAWAAFRGTLRAWTRLRGWPLAGTPGRAQRCRRAALVLLAATTLMSVMLGWSFRLGRAWARRELADRSYSDYRYYARTRYRLGMDERHDFLAMFAALRQGRTPAERTAGLKMLVERFQYLPFRLIQQAATTEPDTELAALELRVLGLWQVPDVGDFLEKFTIDSRSGVRAAAIDALGLHHADPYGTFTSSFNVRAASTPPVSLAAFGRYWYDNQTRSYAGARPIPLPAQRRALLTHLMLAAPTPDERAASARALLAFPPEGYWFRWAEWGVWGVTPEGQLRPPLDPAADLPRFVLPTGDAATAIESRQVRTEMVIFKPVVHLTVDRPLVIDASVRLQWGRPWFAWPPPDDYVTDDFRRVGSRTGPIPATSPIAALDPPGGTPLRNPLRGYPWIEQPAPTRSRVSFSSAGLRWQSLVVTPDRPPWLTEPAVDAGPKYDWWRRLREVDCSWVTTRGTGDRFLYYDGPTLTKLPMRFVLAPDGAVELRRPPWLPTEPTTLNLGRFADALRVTVNNGAASAQRLDLTFDFDGPSARPKSTPLPGDPASRFLSMLREHGLTPSESEAMLACWQKEFFQTPGDRVLLFIRQLEYDAFCPLEIRPSPSQLVRVGVIWIELKQP